MTGTYTPDGIEMVHIPSGTFVMGCAPSEDGRRPDEVGQTAVTIYHDFYLGKVPVTRAQWRTVMGYSPAGSPEGRADWPASNLSWDEAMAFCARLNAQEGAAGRLPAGYHYSLPTEAQWEYAARAGTTAPRYGDLDAIAWDRDNFDPAKYGVGRKQPNAWGLYDMLGSVWEWCEDEYVPPALVIAKQEGDEVYRLGPAQVKMRDERGGSFIDSPERLRAAARRHNRQTMGQPTIGFRLALVPLGKP